MYHSNMGWDDQIVLRKGPERASEAKSKTAVKEALRTGAPVTTVKKQSVGNQQRAGLGANAIRIEETDKTVVPKLSLNVASTIQKSRAAKGWNRKELAAKIGEKESVVADYETGKILAPNQQILGKMERQLGVKLRGQNIGAPLNAAAPAKK